jgi:hypothetical protein
MIKKEYIYSVIIVGLLLLFLNEFNNNYEDFKSEPVISTYDKRYYNVVHEFDDRNIAANKLAILHEFIINYLRYVKNKFIIEKSGTIDQANFFNRILENYNPDSIFENDPLPGEETSYVSNKGNEFGICLREKELNSGKFHELSILKFVMLHELTHLGCLSYGHNIEFWTSFKMVLSEAVNSGLYKPRDYSKSKNKINYCGLIVKHNPYCDGINKCL